MIEKETLGAVYERERERERESYWDNCEFKPNNIYNVDCYEAIKNIPDKSIDLVYIDIPYDLEDNGDGGCFGEKGRDYHK